MALLRQRALRDALAWAADDDQAALAYTLLGERSLGTAVETLLQDRLTADEVLVERTEKEGWAVAADDGVTVALDTELDDELRTEARVYDLIHRVNGMRKEAGLELTDRIVLRLPTADADLLAHEGKGVFQTKMTYPRLIADFM